jgi:hypothetical protein
MLCLAGTAVLLAISRIFIGSVLKEPATLDVQLEAPAQVRLNEPFAMTLSLTNLITASQTLHSIDLDNGFVKNVRLQNSVPSFTDRQVLPLAQFTTFVFSQEIPAEHQIVVTLQFVGERVGKFTGVMDICLADGTLCLAVPLETAVVEK